MGGLNALDVVSDVANMTPLTGFGMIDISKGRLNVPFSGAHMGTWARSFGNLATGEQVRGDVNDTLSTPLAKQIETGVGIAVLTAITAGAGGAFSGAEAGAEAGAAGAEAGAAGAEAGAAGAEAGGVSAAAASPTVASGLAAEAAPPVATGSLAALTDGVPVTAASLPASGIPVSAGALQSATAADVAGASLTGPVGSVAPATFGAEGSLAAENASNAISGANLTSKGTGLLTSGGDAATRNTFVRLAGEMPADSVAAKGWFAGLDPISKAAIIYGGTQMLSGAAGGMFAGVSADKKLALETLINSQNQTQRNRLNTQNSYAPTLTFNNQLA